MRAKVLLLVLALAANLTPQASLHVVANENQKTKRTDSDSGDARAKRLKAINEVRALQNRVLLFQDSEKKIRALILLGETLWEKGQDRPGARELFAKADDLIRSVRVLETDPAPPAGGRNQDRTAIAEPVLYALKNLLVQKLTRYDASWAQKLRSDYKLDQASVLDKGSLDPNEISAQIRNGQLASATQSLQRTIDNNLAGRQSLISFLSLLFALKAQDPQTADQVFLDALVRLNGQVTTGADDVLIIGNYAFAPRVLSEKLLNVPRPFVSPITFGDVVVQADIAQLRPGVPVAITYAYLRTATQILERGSNSPDETKKRAVAAHLLLPQATSLAPEFVPQLESIKSRASGTDLASQKQPNALPTNSDGSVDLKGVLDAIQAMPTIKQRDQYILRVVQTLYGKGELEGALTVAEKMEDAQGRTQLESVIRFGHGVKAIEAADLETLNKGLKGVDASLPRFLLKLGMAQLRLQKHDETGAKALLNEAISELANNNQDGPQPYLILSAVELLASFDLQEAMARFGDAVKAFNNLELNRKVQSGPTYWQMVTVGDNSAAFPLRVPRLKSGTLASTLRVLSSASQDVKPVLYELKDERMLSEGILAFANALLS